MANVSKILDLIFGSNPSADDLREIIRRIEAKLPEPEATGTPIPISKGTVEVTPPGVAEPDFLRAAENPALFDKPPDPPTKRGRK